MGSDAQSDKKTSVKLMSKFQILKNEVVVSISIMLLFCAFDGLAMLQSTMNRDQGTGVISQALIYIFFCISTLLFPKYVIKRLGAKTVVVISTLSYVPYIVANFYPKPWLMFPTSIITGLGATLLWGSQSTYVSRLAALYSDLRLKSKRRLSVSKPEDSTEENKSFTKTERESEISETELTDLSQKKKSPESDSLHDLASTLENTQKTFIVEDNDFTTESRKSLESTTALFFGFHGMVFHFSFLLSNLISYHILQSGSNITNYDVGDSNCVCGSGFCNTNSSCFHNLNLEPPSDDLRYILTGVYTVLSLSSAVVALVLLDNLNDSDSSTKFSFALLTATKNLGKKKFALLLAPLAFHQSLKVGFYVAEYTKAYIGCAWGLPHIGLVALATGAICSISSSLSGWLIKLVGRIPIFTVAFLFSLASDAALLLWTPNAEQIFMFFVVGGILSVYTAAIFSQLRAFYAVMFKGEEEAAFAVFHFWNSLGFCLAFIYSNYFCTYVKIYIMFTTSIVGYICYVVVEKQK